MRFLVILALASALSGCIRCPKCPDCKLVPPAPGVAPFGTYYDGCNIVNCDQFGCTSTTLGCVDATNDVQPTVIP